jgi:subtilisin family serine protease
MPSRPTRTATPLLVAAVALAASCAPGTHSAPAPPAPADAFLPALETAPDRWWVLDPETDNVAGIALDRAYRELLAGREPARTVVVAIIDSGVDTAHVDLRPVLWRNPGEVGGTGRDDDGNGYVDDVFGWNFIGGPDGRNVDVDTYEVARLFAACTLHASAPPALDCDHIARAYTEKVEETEEMLAQIEHMKNVTGMVWQILENHVGVGELTAERVRAVQTTRREVMQAREIFLDLHRHGITRAMISDELERLEKLVEYGLDPAFDPRPIVGDNYEDVTERFYGNPDVTGPDAAHGTGVAGIVAALRDNDSPMAGIAAGARIMAIRAVPNGDERDKDVANAIRYAVDNGAHIINMSFGKPFSPRKDAVDAAVRYADERGVLLVNAAGNDGQDLGLEESFPSRFFLDGDTARHWIQVGASGWQGGDRVAANFSNFGAGHVHVFAPGVDVLSTAPGDAYEAASGTSFAAPVVSGLAALLMSYFPELDAADVRRIILDSTTPLGDRTVLLPGDEERTERFDRLAKTGGIVNAYRAIELARRMVEANGEG